MRIVTAITAAADVRATVEAGADELYCGVVPPGFTTTPGRSGLNRRYDAGANISNLEDFAAITAEASGLGVPVSVALNEHTYPPAQLPSLVELAARLAEAGSRAVIVADPARVLALRKAGCALDLHLSSVATCTNSEAAGFFADLGIQRVILPRYLSTRQIARVRAANATVDYEAFVMNDGCGFEEGLCLNAHRPAGPMCQMAWRPEPLADGPPDSALVSAFEETWAAYRVLMDVLDHPGGTVSPGGVPKGPCGACALPALAAAGVDYLKIPGREYPLAVRLGALRFVKAVLAVVERGEAPEAVAREAKALRKTPALCASTYTCYFREGLALSTPAWAAPHPVTPADLARALAEQRAPFWAPPALPAAPAAPPPPPPSSPGPPPPPVGPDLARLRRVGSALSAEGLAVRWGDARFELVFADAAASGGVSTVTVAHVEPATRCYRRCGDLGVWHSGSTLSPRGAEVLQAVLRRMEEAEPR